MAYDKKSIAHRFKIVAGQVSGLKKMVEENKYCVDILIQSLAIQKALKEIDKIILESHIDSCVIEQMKNGEEKKAVKELIRIYSLSRKK